MTAFVVIATKGRPNDVKVLLDCLEAQTLAPKHLVVVGAEGPDVEGLDAHPLVRNGVASVLCSRTAGLPLQRNVGTDVLRELGHLAESPHFVAFFDDDFRPASDWLERAARLFAEAPEIAALTGWVLADGVHGQGIAEAVADEYLRGARPAQKHWASGPDIRNIGSAYGCNMAFRDIVISNCRFDEALPLYAWQEDQDYTGQARRFGRVVFTPECRGVHLGNKGGRTSGLRFGYSQIANPIYLMRKGTMRKRKGVRFLARALAANFAKSVRRHPLFDYRGRLRGNLTALFDLMCGRCAPQRITQL